nr:hypothetical protein [Methylobacterium sp. ZNC0032]
MRQRFHHGTAIRRTGHLVAVPLQKARDQQPDLGIVIHHQDMTVIVGVRRGRRLTRFVFRVS